jgi:hypothetical protein
MCFTLNGAGLAGRICCSCSGPFVALSGHTETCAYLSAFGVKADIPRASRGCRSDADDPHVWSGRALQEDFVELADLRSCINVSGL